MAVMEREEQQELRDVIKYDSGPRGFKRAAWFLLIWAGLVAAVGGLFLWDMFGK